MFYFDFSDRLPYRYRQAMHFLLDLYKKKAIEGPRIDSVYSFDQVRVSNS
jgi:hypothetical protein